jgi:hypothetical protein
LLGLLELLGARGWFGFGLEVDQEEFSILKVEGAGFLDVPDDAVFEGWDSVLDGGGAGPEAAREVDGQDAVAVLGDAKGGLEDFGLELEDSVAWAGSEASGPGDQLGGEVVFVEGLDGFVKGCHGGLLECGYAMTCLEEGGV